MNQQFAQDLLKGLSKKQKSLPSKYFYDDNGSVIFQEIMEMPSYYLTESEYEILSVQAKEIIEALAFNQAFNIIELGAGDGLKTFKLLEYLVAQNVDFSYMPIDISQGAMDALSAQLKKKLPKLDIRPKVGDYFDILAKENLQSDKPSLLLFLGSNIGNYKANEAEKLLALFNQAMKKGDALLLGVDLKKNPLTVAQAYMDPQGITKRFNTNLLLRINKTFDANFNIDEFDFYSHYNPDNGEVRSYLVSLRNPKVHLKKLDKTFAFDFNELIFTERSKKYSLQEIEQLASNTQFQLKEHFLDCKHYFSDSLLIK